MKNTLLILLLITASVQSQLLPTPQVDQDIAAINQAASRTTYYGQQLVTALNAAHASVWGLPDDRLSAVLNYIGVEKVVALIALHSQTASALNASLDAAGDTGNRAIVAPSRQYTVGEDGQIALVPIINAEQQP